MRKILFLMVLLGLAGCEYGDFHDRERLYGSDTMENTCINYPDLCTDNSGDW